MLPMYDHFIIVGKSVKYYQIFIKNINNQIDLELQKMQRLQKY